MYRSFDGIVEAGGAIAIGAPIYNLAKNISESVLGGAKFSCEEEPIL